MAKNPRAQAKLAGRWLNASRDPLWPEFTNLWMAYNALYTTIRRPRQSEPSAVQEVIGQYCGQNDAAASLSKIDSKSVDALFHVPPGDCRLDSADPRFRAVTTALVTRYRTSHDNVVKLASLMGLIYQVRCNLLHTSKDPAVQRDHRLVSVCVPILKIVVPRLRKIMMS